MGNRSYLSLQKSEKVIPLFEANNSLPFFWITLLDEKSFDEKLKIWEEVDAHNESDLEIGDNYQPPENATDFVTDRKTFLEKSAVARDFIQKNFPNAFPLYDDFIDFIEAKFEKSNKLLLDFWEFSWFYDSSADFFEELKAEVEAIKNNHPDEIKSLMLNDLVAGGTGFPDEDEAFHNLESYQNALKNRKDEYKRREHKFNKKSLIISLIVLLICPVFSYIAYRMFLENGVSLPIILIVIANYAFYYFSISNIFRELKARKKNLKTKHKSPTTIH